MNKIKVSPYAWIILLAVVLASVSVFSTLKDMPEQKLVELGALLLKAGQSSLYFGVSALLVFSGLAIVAAIGAIAYSIVMRVRRGSGDPQTTNIADHADGDPVSGRITRVIADRANYHRE